MKKLIIILFAFFLGSTAFAQNEKVSTSSSAEMTAAFADSLQMEIVKIMPTDYSIRLLYTSPVSDQGKLLDPKIWRETSNGTVEDNDFVVKLRMLIKAAPSWKPAFDAALNKAVDSKTKFYIIIQKGKIKIDMQGVDEKAFRAEL